MTRTRITCRQVILSHCKANIGALVKKVQFYVICEDWSPETVGRRLRELEEEKIIKVDYYDGRYSKNLAQYSYGGIEKTITKYERVGDTVVAKEEKVMV